MCHWEIYIFQYRTVNNELPSTSFQIAEQVKVIQEVILRGISKLTQHYTKNKETKQFSQKNSGKRNIDLILSIIFPITPIDGSSILQNFFHHLP